MQPYSELRDFKRKPLVEQLPLVAPLALFVELTNRCNFKCKFCPESIENYSELVGGITSISFAQFQKICDEVLEIGRLKVLRFYMLGEPFLYKELPDVITYAKARNVADRIEVTSNATALTPQNCERIVQSGLDYLRISVYSVKSERHKDVTQSNITPAHIRNNIKTLYETRERMSATTPFIYVKMIDPFDPEESSLFLEQYAGIADEVVLEQPMNWNDPAEADFLTNVYGEKESEERDAFFRFKKEVCPFPFFNLIIHSSGHVSVCCVDWEKKTSVGNIFEQSLKEIWNGQPLRDFQRMQIERRRSENEACRNCTFLFTHPDNLDSLTSIKQLYPDEPD